MRRTIAVICFIGAITSLSLGVVANYAYPHGPLYPTGEMIELNDGQSVRPEYKEDLSQLNIPSWVRTSRGSSFFLLPIVVLGIAGTVLWVKGKPISPIERWRAEYRRTHDAEPSNDEINDWIREHGDYYQRASLGRLERP